MGESAGVIGLPTGCSTSLSAKRETLPAAPESPAAAPCANRLARQTEETCVSRCFVAVSRMPSQKPSNHGPAKRCWRSAPGPAHQELTPPCHRPCWLRRIGLEALQMLAEWLDDDFFRVV